MGARTAAMKAKQNCELELADVHQQLDDVSRAKSEIDDKNLRLSREKADLMTNLQENCRSWREEWGDCARRMSSGWKTSALRWWLACCTSLTWSWSITRKTQAPVRWLPAALRPATWWCMTHPGRNRRQWNGTRWTVLEIHSKISIFNIHMILHQIILYHIIS